MHSSNCHRRAVVLGLVLFSLPAWVAGQQPSAGEVSAGPMRSEVTLGFRTVTVVSTPALQADDPAHRMLLSTTTGSRDGYVRIGQFETDASIRIDAVEIELDEPEGRDEELPLGRYDLWLTGVSDAWTLQVADVQDSAATEPSAVLGTARLAHTTTAVASPTFLAGLVPAGSDGGRLLLRWGRHEWTTAVQFSAPRARARRRRESGVGTERTFEFDTSELQRASRLGRRNIATVTLPDGPRLSVVYPKGLNVEDRDFAHLVSVATDAVVRVTAGAVTRLDIDVPLQFGDVTLETGNVGLRGSPGAYGIWLKRVADGWRLVFNDEPDAWGSQHDPAFDAAEVDLEYSQADDSSRALSASVAMLAADQGRFVLVWGPHEWTADFVVAR